MKVSYCISLIDTPHILKCLLIRTYLVHYTSFTYILLLIISNVWMCMERTPVCISIVRYISGDMHFYFTAVLMSRSSGGMLRVKTTE